MDVEPLLGKGSLLLGSFFDSDMHQQDSHASSSNSARLAPSVTVIREVTVQDQAATITPSPELRVREPVPQNADCGQASRDAEQAIRQASQSASQSIQQASQQASEAARQASQSASQAIQQAQNSASQSIAQASRSASQAQSSASSVVASIQSSASAAVSRAQESLNNAQASVSTAQGEASRAVLQAGAAVAAATGSAAAAGSSFLAAAAKATSGAQSSVAAFGAAASSSVSQASEQAAASQNAAVTATQAALAIVGSIIASALITILISFLIMRHKKKSKKRSLAQKISSPHSPQYPSDPKFPVSDQVATTVAASQSAYNGNRDGQPSSSRGSMNQYQKSFSKERTGTGDSSLKTTTLPWNPSKPPKAPTLGSWLQVQENSPFGPIKLPTDPKSSSPLGGQLKSPLQSTNKPQSQIPDPRARLPLRSPRLPVLTENVAKIVVIPRSVSKGGKSIKKERSLSEKPVDLPVEKELVDRYRESKASVWTDDVPYTPASAPLRSPPKQEAATPTIANAMKIPSPRNPVRTTADWLESIKDAAEPPQSVGDPRSSRSGPQPVGEQRSSRNGRPPMGLPGNPRSTGGGFPRRGVNNRVQSIEEGYVQGLNRFLPHNRNSVLTRSATETGGTPGVGKAI